MIHPQKLLRGPLVALRVVRYHIAVNLVLCSPWDRATQSSAYPAQRANQAREGHVEHCDSFDDSMRAARQAQMLPLVLDKAAFSMHRCRMNGSHAQSLPLACDKLELSTRS